MPALATLTEARRYYVIKDIQIILLVTFKVLMVTGGYNQFTDPHYLDTTEIYSDDVWRIVAAKLPVGISSLRAVTIDQRVLLFGKSKYF